MIHFEIREPVAKNLSSLFLKYIPLVTKSIDLLSTYDSENLYEYGYADMFSFSGTIDGFFDPSFKSDVEFSMKMNSIFSKEIQRSQSEIEEDTKAVLKISNNRNF